MKITSDTKIYAGTNEIKKVYKGTDVIYENNSTPYTPLEYIQSSGTQYINANLPNYTTGFKVELKYQFTVEKSNQFLWGAEGYSPYNRNYFKRSSSSKMEVGAYWYNSINFYTNIGTTYTAVVRTLKNIEQSLYIDGSMQWSSASYMTENRTELTPYIFALNARGTPSEFAYMKLYYIKFYDNTNRLLRDFIPVLDSNNIPCLYDKVSETFFYNAGSGTFLYE